MDISKLGILILKLYRFRDNATIDRIADEFLKVADIEDTSGTDPVAAAAPVTTAPDHSGSFSPELSALLDLLRPMTEQQLKGISDLIKGGSRLDQIARLVDLELSQTGRDLPEYDKLISIQTQLTELRANKDKHGRSQIEKFNDRYGKEKHGRSQIEKFNDRYGKEKR